MATEQVELKRYIIYEENMDGTPRFTASVISKEVAQHICNMLSAYSSETYMYISAVEWERITDGK